MILGIDLGQTIGFVKGRAVGPLQRGSFELKNTSDLGAWLKSSDPFFRDILHDVTAIGVEQPFMGRDYYPARKLLALLGHLYYWANTRGISSKVVQEVPVSTGKLTLSGRGNAEAWQMIEAAAKLGYEDMDEHQAHALGIWWVVVHGAREPIAKARAKSGKGRSVLNAPSL